jgi:uncharacterized protein involved in exopolysaccharide biosynthesis
VDKRSLSARAYLGRLDLKWVLDVCLKRRHTITAVALGVTALAMLYALVASPVYRASAKLVIDPRQQKILSVENVLPGLSADAAAIETQVEMLSSGKIAQRVIREMQREKEAPAAPILDRQIKEFLSSLTVSRKGLTYVVTVSYSAKDPVSAAEVANRIVQAYLAEETDAALAATQRAHKLLQVRIERMRPQLMEIERSIEQYREKHGLVAIESHTVGEKNILDFVTQLAASRATSADAEAKLELDKMKNSFSMQSQEAFRVAQTKVSLMERRLSNLTEELASQRIRTIELRELDRQASALRSLYDSLLKRHIETEAQQDLTTFSAKVIEEALPPSDPIWPRKSLLLSSGLLMGFCLGVLYVVARALLLDEAS